MAENQKRVKTRIINMHDTEANWHSNANKNKIPEKGELIIYDIDTTYTYERFKIGDGKTTVIDLPFASIQADHTHTKSQITDFPAIPAAYIHPDKHSTDFIKTENEFTVNLGNGGTLGSYKTGDKIASNTSIDTILKKLLQKAIPATYNKPTVSLNNNGGTSSGTYEVGSTITPKLKATFTKNDAGGLTTISILQGNTTKKTGTTSPLEYTGDAFVIGDETVTFSASASYSAAPAKNNNLGDPSTENQFGAGSCSSGNYSITGARQLFWFTGTGTLPTLTSNFIRGTNGANGKLLDPSDGYSFNIKVNEGQQYIVIAYPADLRDITQIKYVEANDSNMANNFTKTQKQVADARGGENGLKDYKVYIYSMPVPAAAVMNFEVTI